MAESEPHVSFSLYRTQDCWDASLFVANPFLQQLLTPPTFVTKIQYSLAELKKYHLNLARRLLKPWLKTGIRHDDIRQDFIATKDFDKDDAIFVQYINKSLFVSKVTNHRGSREKHFLSLRRKHGIYAIHDAVSQRKDIGDFELYLGVSDSPINRGINFGLVAASENSRTLPLSQMEWDFMSNADWNRTLEKVFTWRDSYPWNSRTSKAIFRGGKGTCFPPSGDENAISNASIGSLIQKGLLLCGRSALKRTSETCAAGMVDFNEDYLSLKDQERAKYVIYAEGHQGWANRLKYYLGMGNAIIMQLNRGGQEWYAMLGMAPWVHYIPVDHLFNSLPAVLNWAREHDDMVKTISANADAYARNFLSEASFRTYLETLLFSYSNLFQYTPVLNVRASNFDEYLKVKRNLDGVSFFFSEWPNVNRAEREATMTERLQEVAEAANQARVDIASEHHKGHVQVQALQNARRKFNTDLTIAMCTFSVFFWCMPVASRRFRRRAMM
jgi:hypothetical protein